MKFFDSLKEIFVSGHNVSPVISRAESAIKTMEQPQAQSQVFENILVAKVTKVEKHPNADRLRVIELTDGNATYGPVVCGAWNFDLGAIVPLALPGAVIPHDQHDPEGKPFTLGKATIRGVESQGMICSGKELGLTADGGGILLLPESASIGSVFSSDLVKSPSN